MSSVPLLGGITAVQTVAAVGYQNPVANMATLVGTPVPQGQSFVATVTGTGSVSCTVQIVGSNDGANWTNYGSALAVTAATNTASASAVGNIPFQFLGAFATAISGTGAKVSVIAAF